MISPTIDLILDAAFFAVGSCRGPERMARRQGPWRVVRFPALAVMLRHATRGVILFDTGYAPRYFDVLRRWPYRLLGPGLGARLSATEALPAQMLARNGVRPGDVQTLIVSHFHLDHIAGLRDFPRAEIVCSQAALTSVQSLREGGWRAASRAYHPGMLPEDFAARVRPLPDLAAQPAEGFAHTWDVFGDGSARAVSLPGHAAGQLGLRFRCRGEEFFLVADACWHEAGLREHEGPHPLAERLFWEDPVEGKRTRRLLETFASVRPEVRLIPSHCPRAVARHAAALRFL